MSSATQIVIGPMRDSLGEGPLWSARRQSIIWVDILNQRLQIYNLMSGAFSVFDMPERIGWAIERQHHESLVIGLKSGFAIFDIQTEQIRPIGNPEPDRPFNRLNDAAVDQKGRIWAGSKHDTDQGPTGALYRLDPDLRWSRHDDGYVVSNGPAFSLDGRTLYHTDTLARTVFAFALEDDGTLHSKRVFLTFDDDWGFPDGMTTDAAGGLWIAHWGGGRVSRFDDTGKLDRSIGLPASQITNCAFGGDRLDRMFVTSAAIGVTDEPDAGALFEIDPGVAGIAAVPFAG